MEAPEQVLDIVSACSGKRICTLRLPRSAAVHQIKQRIQAVQGSTVYCQRLLLASSSTPMDDQVTLESLFLEGAMGDPAEPLRLLFVQLAHTDVDDVDAGRRLLAAARGGQHGAVACLLGVPMWPDYADERGRTSLYIASESGNLEVARLLCEASASVDKAMQDGGTALMQAAHGGHMEVVRLLCQARANLDKKRTDGASALFLASEAGHLEVAQYLCRSGAELNKAMQDGPTALLLAFQNG